MLDLSRLSALVSVHAPGFSVSMRDDGDVIELELTHPASIGTVLVVDQPDALTEGRLVNWLARNPEVQRVLQAPGDLPHPERCLRLYTASQALRWDVGTVREVAAMLVEAGGLTEAEAAWLSSTP